MHLRRTVTVAIPTHVATVITAVITVHHDRLIMNLTIPIGRNLNNLLIQDIPALILDEQLLEPTALRTTELLPATRGLELHVAVGTGPEQGLIGMIITLILIQLPGDIGNGDIHLRSQVSGRLQVAAPDAVSQEPTRGPPLARISTGGLDLLESLDLRARPCTQYIHAQSALPKVLRVTTLL
jgi:hypothetical protein